MNIIKKALLSSVLVVSGCGGVQTVYVDAYKPVIFMARVQDCPSVVEYYTQNLTKEQAADYGTYAKSHAADDKNIHDSYQICFTINKLQNETADAYNQKALLGVPLENRPEVIKQLPVEIKKGLSSNIE